MCNSPNGRGIGSGGNMGRDIGGALQRIREASASCLRMHSLS